MGFNFREFIFDIFMKKVIVGQMALIDALESPSPPGPCALVVTGVDPGLYQVFVRSYDTAAHGWQWVGWHGGTGQRQWARVIRVRSGANTVLPDIRLDPPGSITGVVTDAAGAPVRHGRRASWQCEKPANNG